MLGPIEREYGRRMTAVAGVRNTRSVRSAQLTTAPGADLVHAAGSGDRDAWNALVERYSSMVWAVARSHRLTAADAADVSQTTWLRLLDHLDDIRQPERVGAWLATTARRESLRVIRMSQRQVTMPNENIAERDHGTHRDLDTDLLEAERDLALWEAFEGLPARCRVILPLLMGEKALSYKDFSEALDMPIGSIGPTRQRCLDHLRRLVAKVAVLHDANDEPPAIAVSVSRAQRVDSALAANNGASGDGQIDHTDEAPASLSG
jgi:RNA polymerase sigma factor (sigma-70 family)